jgi:hypothetical protein
LISSALIVFQSQKSPARRAQFRQQNQTKTNEIGQIRFLILPDMLKNAPMFKKIGQQSAAAARAVPGPSRGKTKTKQLHLFLLKDICIVIFHVSVLSFYF